MTARLGSMVAFLVGLLFCCSSTAADQRTPILGPHDNNKNCCAPPSEASIRRALPGATARFPFVFTSVKLSDSIDPPRFYPLVGLAQLHHVHWKCTVHIMVPAPCEAVPIRFRTESVFIDQDHLHIVR